MKSEDTVCIPLTDIANLRNLQKKPKRVKIGDDAFGYFKRLSLAQFMEAQDQLSSIEKSVPELPEEMKNDPDENKKRTIALVERTRDVVSSLMIAVMTTEKGDPAFAEKDKEAIKETISPSFSKEFVSALIISQGIGEGEIANANASFR